MKTFSSVGSVKNEWCLWGKKQQLFARGKQKAPQILILKHTTTGQRDPNIRTYETCKYMSQIINCYVNKTCFLGFLTRNTSRRYEKLQENEINDLVSEKQTKNKNTLVKKNDGQKVENGALIGGGRTFWQADETQRKDWRSNIVHGGETTSKEKHYYL
ncbi:hypothetical protein RUM44_008742 [Polyplax serrata]|uniref:Uncharacterized protein n=1 Tax=Polyplax serrata TaxID=468196 RepID=A0ABR1B947_POLSC